MITISPGQAGPILDRVTSPEVPGQGSIDQGALDYAYWFLGMSEQWQEQHLGQNAAFSFSPYWACINAITHSMCSVGWHQFEHDGANSNQIALEDPISWALDMQINEEQSSLDWREVMLKDALDCGNGISEIVRDGYMRFQAAYRIAPERVQPERTKSGKLIYEVENGSGVSNDVLEPSQVFHLKGIGPDGLWGWSIREFARRSIKLGIDEEGYGSSFFSRGIRPTGILKFTTKQSPEQLREYKKGFEVAYGGKKNQGGVVAISGPMDFTPWTVNNKEAEMTEARILQGLEMCRFFRVPPHKIFDLSHATFSNIEEQNIEFVTDCLLYWAKKLEAEADLKLYGRTNRGKRYTRLNLAALLRGNLLAQTEAIAKQITMGLRTPDEARAFWDLNPYPKKLGSNPVIQGAMVRLDSLTSEPKPVPAPPGAQPPQPGQQPPQPNGQPPKPNKQAAKLNGKPRAQMDKLLAVPDYRQSDDYDCGCACVHAVAEFFGVGNGRTEQDYIDELGATETDGTEPEAIIDCLNDSGLTCTSGPGMSIADLDRYCEAGCPVIVPVQMYGDTSGYGAEEIQNQTGHYVVVIGVGMGQVVFQDPSAGRQMLSSDDFDRIWHDMEADGVVDDHFGIAVCKNMAQMPMPGDMLSVDVAATFTDLISQAYERLGRVEFDKAQRAKNKGRLAEHIKSFHANSGHIVQTLAPIYQGFGHAARREVSDNAAHARAKTYVETIKKSLATSGPDALKELDRVALARDDIAFLWGANHGT